MNNLTSASCTSVLLLALGCTTGLAQAQVIFRKVGPDGAVSFSDKVSTGKDSASTLSASSRLPVGRAASEA